MRRVVLVTGPPCAGKSTHVQAHAQPGDLILDQDLIGRTAMTAGLRRIATMTDGTAWVIRCCPGQRARHQLATDIGATERVHLVQPEATLINRAAHRTNPRRHIAAVSTWFVKERANPAPARRKTGAPHKTTTERGLGWAHQQARTHALTHMQDGQACARCGRPMYRNNAKLLDLDHTEDRTGYRGLAHRRCNRQAGQAKGIRQRTTTRQPKPAPRSATTPHSRNW